MVDESRQQFVPWDGSMTPPSAPRPPRDRKDGPVGRPASAAKFKSVYGMNLNSDPGFANAIDGKRLVDAEMYFMVTPYAFARRCMMRTATVRTLLLDRKLPRVVTSDDQLMVVVSMDWITGNLGKAALDFLGFNPEDYLDAE